MWGVGCCSEFGAVNFCSILLYSMVGGRYDEGKENTILNIGQVLYCRFGDHRGMTRTVVKSPLGRIVASERRWNE